MREYLNSLASTAFEKTRDIALSPNRTNPSSNSVHLAICISALEHVYRQKKLKFIDSACFPERARGCDPRPRGCIKGLSPPAAAKENNE
jgi:hypothetical protein